MRDLEELRRRFLAEQAEGAEAEAVERIRRAAGARGVVYRRETTPWIRQLLREARHLPCPHAPRQGSALVIVPAHVPRWLCRGCADRAVVSPLDAVRCDVCREVANPLIPFMVHSGTVLVSGKHCPGCRPVVEVVDR